MGLFKKSIIGLEMDSKEIRTVEISGSKKNPVISAWGRIELADGAVKEGKVADTDILSENIAKLMELKGFKDKNVVLGVNNQDIIVRFATFPKVPDDKIRNMVMLQAEDYIPVPTTELEIDYIITGERESEGRQFINVILVGARKKMINDYIKCIESVGLNVVEIDSTMLAIARSALIYSDTGTFAAVGYNHDIGNIMIFRDGILEFARTISMDSEENQPEPEADLISDILLNEIRSSVNYYLSQNFAEINKIFLCGVNISQKTVASKIQNFTGIQVEIPDPYKSYKITGTHAGSGFNASDFNACISLALRGMEE